MIIGLAAACGPTSSHASRAAGNPPPRPHPAHLAQAGIHKIKHVIVVMQENRSFDTYFGTYPGADGIPMKNEVPTVCLPKPGGGCGRPYHVLADINAGGPHGVADATVDVDGGKMDGFIK